MSFHLKLKNIGVKIFERAAILDGVMDRLLNKQAQVNGVNISFIKKIQYHEEYRSKVHFGGRLNHFSVNWIFTLS
jgi:hypothetical protein